MASQVCDATSGCKRKRRDRAQSMVIEKNDPFMVMMGDFQGHLKNISGHIATMAQAAVRDVELQEDQKKKLTEMALLGLNTLGFTGSEVVRCARWFVKQSNEIPMMMAVPENLRREFVIEMLKEAAAARP